MNKGYKDLHVWHQAMTLAEHIYEATKGFPQDERFGLTSQMRRAAISVPSNIAEGRGRGSDPALIRFCGIAYGSLMELETQTELATRFGYLTTDASSKLTAACEETGRMLNALRASLSSGQSSADDRRPTTDDQRPMTNDR